MPDFASVPLGATVTPEGVQFAVWAPLARRLDLVLDGREVPLTAQPDGLFTAFVPDLKAGARYRYRKDGGAPFPDPASRFQPEGVHGPSEVVDDAFAWSDAAWMGVAQRDLVFYELHVGTFTPPGTFAAAMEKLPYLRELGVTAVELMPVADWPGRWGWGYDHAALWAPSRAYGTPDDLRRFVDAAHAHGLAVFLDVIYNHLGPDGAYAAAFAPMFTDRHHTPWGRAVNLDDTHSAGVRRFFIDNALMWLRDYHADGLRLDATDTLQDDSTPHFLAELTQSVAALETGPRRVLVAEDHRNLNTVVRPRQEGGYGLDAVWVDDFHHLVRNLTAGDTEQYYAAYAGATAAQIARTLEQNWFYTGQVSAFSGQPRGTDPSGVRPENVVFCIQNHDQIGNRPLGNRLTDDVPLAVFKAASALLLFAPQLPLLFMGQEYAATTPFLFFSDHEPGLGRKVTEGRKKEFEGFSGFGGEVPDPQSEATFRTSKLDWQEARRPEGEGVRHLYQTLLALRPHLPPELDATPAGDAGLLLRRGDYALAVALRPGVDVPVPDGLHLEWHTALPRFGPAGTAPEHAGGLLHFADAGAALFRG